MNMKFVLSTIALLVAGTTFASPISDSWYASAFGGYTHLSSNIKTRYFGFLLSDVNYRYGYNVGGSLGYQTNPLRYEFQYNYLYGDTNQYSVNHKKAKRIDGGTKANVLMANLYYDFPEMLDEISPYLGVGMGYALMHATLNSTSRFKCPHFKLKQDSFAYQGTAGLAYNFVENLAINTVYRYTATTNKNNWGKTLQAQMINLEIVYRFDKDSFSFIG